MKRPSESAEPQPTIKVRFQGRVLELQVSETHPYALLEAYPFKEWIRAIGDQTTQDRINVRLICVRRGTLGLWREVGDGINELKLDFGPGYRIYFARFGKQILLLLGGGDKSDQSRDIASAQRLWKELKDGGIEQI